MPITIAALLVSAPIVYVAAIFLIALIFDRSL